MSKGSRDRTISNKDNPKRCTLFDKSAKEKEADKKNK